jgi:hypothetical protein
MDLPGDDALRWIVQTYARLRAAHGEALGAPDLVQPNATFFPDDFRRDAESVARLLRRMIEYSPLADDLPVGIAFHEPSAAQEGGGGCGSLACGSDGSHARGESSGRVDEVPGGYVVHVAVPDVAYPEVLAASLARSVGALVLREGGDEGATADSAEACEVAAVACGFGVLLANGAAVWAKSCGGLRMVRATSLPVEEVAVALGLFVAVAGARPSDARAHLGTTQREALDAALAWTESNPLLVESLRDRPSSLIDGRVELEPVRGALGRWLYRRRVEKELRAVPPARPQPALSHDKERRLAEARALVDEVLGE